MVLRLAVAHTSAKHMRQRCLLVDGLPALTCQMHRAVSSHIPCLLLQIQVARLLLSRGRLAEAEHKVQKLCSAGLPDSPELLCLKGQLHLSSKDALG